MANEYDIVIAGAGIAGLTAATYSARLGRKTLLLTGNVPGGLLLSINRIDGYPGFPEGVPGYDLCPMAQEDAVAAGAELAGGELTAIDEQDGQYLLTAGSDKYLTRSLIIATGARLKTLAVPGEEQYTGRGVSHCASCDAPILREHTVAVVGGGDSALQEALTLAEASVQVIILQQGESLTAQPVYQRQVEQSPAVSVRCNTVVEEILGEDAVTGVRIKDLKTDSTEQLEVSAVFVYVGLQPNTDFLQGRLALDDSGRIITDGQLRTQTSGILAAGIVRSGAAGQAVGSAGDGAIAAKAANRYLSDSSWC